MTNQNPNAEAIRKAAEEMSRTQAVYGDAVKAHLQDPSAANKTAMDTAETAAIKAADIARRLTGGTE